MNDLVTWLREQIAEDVERWRPVLAGARRNGKATAREVLARCEAHELILTLAETVYVGYAAVTALGLAYQHRPGYREEWRP